MKTTLYAIVPGETREEAIENAHGAFLELCPTKSGAPGGTNPIFDWYRLYTDLAENDDDIYPHRMMTGFTRHQRTRQRS